MLRIAKQSVLATMLMGTNQARRHLDDVQNNRHLVLAKPDENYEEATGEATSPLVEGADCVPMCLFRDTVNSFCWKLQSPSLSAGWDFKQSSGTNYWQAQWQPYIKAFFYFQYDFIIDRLYTNTTIFTMPEFQLDLYYSYLFSKTGQQCIGFGWNLGNILAQIKTTIQMRDCSKILVYSVCEQNIPWLGNSSQWLDTCVDSTAPQLSVMNHVIAPAISDQNLLGGKTMDGPGCFQFAMWNKWAPYMADFVGPIAKALIE